MTDAKEAMEYYERRAEQNKETVDIEFTVGEIREMILPLYEFHIFDMIRNDPDIDNPRWLRGQMRIYGRLLNAIGEDNEDDES